MTTFSVTLVADYFVATMRVETGGNKDTAQDLAIEILNSEYGLEESVWNDITVEEITE